MCPRKASLLGPFGRWAIGPLASSESTRPLFAEEERLRCSEMGWPADADRTGMGTPKSSNDAAAAAAATAAEMGAVSE